MAPLASVSNTHIYTHLSKHAHPVHQPPRATLLRQPTRTLTSSGSGRKPASNSCVTWWNMALSSCCSCLGCVRGFAPACTACRALHLCALALNLRALALRLRAGLCACVHRLCTCMHWLCTCVHWLCTCVHGMQGFAPVCTGFAPACTGFAPACAALRDTGTHGCWAPRQCTPPVHAGGYAHPRGKGRWVDRSMSSELCECVRHAFTHARAWRCADFLPCFSFSHTYTSSCRHWWMPWRLAQARGSCKLAHASWRAGTHASGAPMQAGVRAPMQAGSCKLACGHPQEHDQHQLPPTLPQACCS